MLSNLVLPVSRKEAQANDQTSTYSFSPAEGLKHFKHNVDTF